MSYRKKHIKNKVNRIKPKKSIFTRLWFWIGLLSVIVIASVAYLAVFYSGVQIKNIIVSGNQKVLSQDIENLISDNINYKILGIGSWKISSRSIFLIDSDKLQKEVLDKFPIIENVKVVKRFMQTLELQVNERAFFAVFCPSLDRAIEGIPGKCFSMDNNGIIFEPLYVMPQNIVIVLQAENGRQIFAGENVVSQDIMDLITKVGKNLKDNLQINLKEAFVADSNRLNVTTSENWQIYFDLGPGSDISSQLTKLNLLLKGGISPTSRKNLRYIDLRPEDRAIVCDNGECGFPH